MRLMIAMALVIAFGISVEAEAATTQQELSTTRVYTVSPDGSVCIEFDLAKEGETVKTWTDPRYGEVRSISARAMLYAPRLSVPSDGFLVRTATAHDNVRISVSDLYRRSPERQAAEVVNCGAEAGSTPAPDSDLTKIESRWPGLIDALTQ